jgi:CHRD domain
MKKLWLFTAVVIVGALAVFGTVALGGGSNSHFRASLDGYQEVPSKSTVARGTFRARFDDGVIKYTLSYRNLETPALFAHIHFAQRHVNGGVIAFLCGGGDKPDCPATTGTVRGVIGADDIVGPGPSMTPGADQGIEPGSLREALRALRAGAVYANLHSERFPSGEIRGQVGKG